MPLAVVERFLTIDRPDPLPVGSFLNVLRLLGIDTTIETHVHIPLANPRNCGKILGNWDLDIGIAMFPAWPCNDMIYSFVIAVPPAAKPVLYMPKVAEYASCS